MVDAGGVWSIPLVFRGTGGWGRNRSSAISAMANVDPSTPELELVAGRGCVRLHGRRGLDRTDLPEGYSAIADFELDGVPEVALVGNGQVYLLDGATGVDKAPPIAAPGANPGNGGPPTIADFDRDFVPEIGVAYREFYQVVELNAGTGQLKSSGQPRITI